MTCQENENYALCIVKDDLKVEWSAPFNTGGTRGHATVLTTIVNKVKAKL